MEDSPFNHLRQLTSLQDTASLMELIEKSIHANGPVRYAGTTRNMRGFPLIAIAPDTFGGGTFRTTWKEVTDFAYTTGKGLLLLNQAKIANEVPFGFLWSFHITRKLLIPPTHIGSDHKVEFENLQMREATALEVPDQIRATLQSIAKDIVKDRQFKLLMAEDKSLTPPVLSLISNVFKDDFDSEDRLSWYRNLLQWLYPLHFGVHIIEKSNPLAKHFDPPQLN